MYQPSPYYGFSRSRHQGRSKSRVAENENWKLEYDGKKLKFQGWSETKPLEQAKNQALWLSLWLSKVTGASCKVVPALAIPGCWTDRTAPGDMIVYNGKESENTELITMNNTFEDISYYFEESANFELLPVLYQNKIIKFFLEERHYMVDPRDVKDFLESGSKFSISMSLKNLAQTCKTTEPEGILACKRVWKSMERFAEWGEKVKSFGKDDTVIIFLTHAIEFPSDIADEWYIISY